MSFLQKFDAYPKTMDDVRVKTIAGATVTIISTTLIIILLISEFSFYRDIEVLPEIVVDTQRGEKMRINLNITMHKIPCEFLTVDIMDVSGEHQEDISHDIFKIRLDLSGNRIDPKPKKHKLGDNSAELVEEIKQAVEELPPDYCGSCYGGKAPPSGCCQTCADVRNAYAQMGWGFSNPDGIEQCKREGWSERLKNFNEGCNIYGHVEVNKVIGNFHIAPGKSFQQHHAHIHDIQPFLQNAKDFSTSHTIHRLSFGTEIPNIFNPLDGVSKLEDGPLMFQYFVKVVPTTYTYINGTKVETNQFSVTQHQTNVILGQRGLPGVIFNYDISPMLVIYTQKRKSILHFLTGVCAIVGGIFTVAGIIDSFVYKAEKTLKKKVELGKLS